MSRKFLVTTALPYANARMHLGNIVGYIQTDIWTRFQKMCGNNCIYVCGSDSHGTPIMISAEKEGVSPETFIKKINEGHIKDFEGFYIDFDNYHSTHSEENRELSELFYNTLKNKGDIEIKTIEQFYDPVKNMFLPDRFVKGECPKCGAKDQYGDNCEVCGKTYSPTDLKNPYSIVSGATPITKTSEHYFFKLPNYEQFLKKWTREGHLQEQVANKLNEWFLEGLQDWDISRDAPYFGFEIPDTKDKYFYCWLDAPIGYIASFKNLCSKRKDLNFDDYWNQESEIELYHFIGKDILYFHTLFWPAVLKGVGFKIPNAVFVHGFLTIDGQKLSKSRGTFIKANSYLEHLDPEYLRYYFASKLSSKIEDIDLNFEDFRLKINSDLVGKVINIASRCASFINKYFDGKLSDSLTEKNLFEKFVTKKDILENYYENREYSNAVREIMALSDLANQYIDEHKPWQLAKEANRLKEVQEISTMGLNLFRILMIYLKPILPKVAEKTEDFLNIKPLSFEDIDKPLINHKINEFKPLMKRVEIENIEALKQASKIS